jgi:hypothetical protein
LLTTSSRNYESTRENKLSTVRKVLVDILTTLLSTLDMPRQRSVSYLLVANGGVAFALTVNPHKGIGQTLDSDGNLDKVVKGNIAATFRFFT